MLRLNRPLEMYPRPEIPLPEPGAPDPGAPPPDLDRFAGESMRSVWWGWVDTTKKPGFKYQKVACVRWDL